MRQHTASSLSALALSFAGLTSAPSAAAQSPAVFFACYVPSTGTVYRIKEPGLPAACAAKSKPDVQFSWTDGVDAVRNTTIAGGDASGTFGALTVGKLLGRPLAAAVPAVGHDLTWDGSAWTAQPVLRPSSVASGDLTGALGLPTVAKLQGRAIDPTAPSDGQVLAWNGALSTWMAKTPPAGVTVHSQLSGLNVGDDHPQYLPTNGTRTTMGFAVTGVTGPGTVPASGAGIRLMWYPNKAAFRVGQVDAVQWDEPSLGFGSIAAGLNTTASGQYAVAMGANSLATGDVATAFGANAQARGTYAVALGQDVTASGPTAVAMGGNILASGQSSIGLGNDVRSTSFASIAMGVGGTTSSGIGALAAGNGAHATGNYSTALGNNDVASGLSSTALGTLTTASGDYSTAMGFFASTNGHQGAFVFGDNSTTNAVTAEADHEFVVRGSGGFRFRTSSDLSTGCDLPAGSGTFNCTSSRRLKTGFEPVDAEGLLLKLQTLPVTRWSYVAEGTGVRHLGPFAEDFREAFGLGTDEASIGILDIAGVGIAAAKALEVRTRSLASENAALRKANADILRRLAQLEAGLASLRPSPQ